MKILYRIVSLAAVFALLLTALCACNLGSSRESGALSANEDKSGTEVVDPDGLEIPETTQVPSPEPTATPTPTEEPTQAPLPEPELTLELSGEAVMEADRCAFEDPGVEVYDNWDEDAQSKVVIEGYPDTEVCGEYHMTYRITSISGLEAEAQRTVYIRPNREDVEAMEAEGKLVYLTFDDGPSGNTQRLLDILGRYNAKATFFVCETGMLDMLPKELEAGHGIAVHSYTHDYAIYSSEETFFDDFTKMQDAIYDKIGYRTRMLRFPGGGSNTVSKKYCKGIMSTIAQRVEELGYTYFDWNVSSGDGGGYIEPSKVTKNVIKGIQNYRVSVVLLHDSHSYTVDGVEDILKWGTENGYRFEALSPYSLSAHHGIRN